MSVVQIAAHAGVSIATVSRVLNNRRHVNPKLAEQVHRAMTELNFSPDQIRRKTVRKTDASIASTIAIVSLGQNYRGWFEIPVMSAVVAEIMRAAGEHQLGTLITEMPDPDEMSTALRRQAVQGALVFINSNLNPSSAGVIASHIPIVRVMGGQFARLTFDHVGPDNSAIGNMAGHHLLQQGCRELIYLTSRPGWDMSKLRGQGFAVAALGADIRPHVFIEGDVGNFDCIYGNQISAAPDLTALVGLLAQHLKRPTADGQPRGPVGLFVSRDEETVFVYRILAAHGLKPGRDLIVVSCDNEEVRLSALHPRPASVDLDARQIARNAVERLIERIRRPDESPVRMLVTPTLVTADRQSAINAASATAGSIHH